MGNPHSPLNPLSAQDREVLASIRFPEVPEGSCSLGASSDLEGTASHEPGWVALEQPGAWGKDIFDGVAFDAALGEKLQARLTLAGDLRLLLIRKPGRLGQLVAPGQRRVFISRQIEDRDRLFTFCVKGPEDLLDLPLDTPWAIPFAEELPETTVTLVCAHAKRDQCCALRGRPLAQFLARVRPSKTVWECSHLSGHRFAPTALLLPSGYTYGKVGAEQLLAAISALEDANIPLIQNLRGCSNLPPVHQVAELAVREVLLTEGHEPQTHGLSFTSLTSEYESDGIYRVQASFTPEKGDFQGESKPRTWMVEVESFTTEPLLASCGKAPKPTAAYRPLGISEI